MRFAARVLISCVILSLLVGLALPLFSSRVFAQTTNYTGPNVENNVPRDQHTQAQTTLNEMFFAIGCQIIGIDFSNPAIPCLTLNPLTHQFGYNQTTSPDGKPRLGGLLGSLNNGIAMLYTPTISTVDYTQYVASNFGIVKPALAAPKNGFEGLSPLLNLWKAARDASYFFLIIAFIFIGLGIMMRVKIDPRTVMTIQNQIPRVIIAIILITFSYPIAAAMTDVMWATTYMGINLITNSSSVTIAKCGPGKQSTLGGLATSYVLSTPFSFVNNVFQTECGAGNPGGIIDLANKVGDNLSELTVTLVLRLLGIQSDPSCSLASLVNPLDCFYAGIKNMMSFLWALVVFIIIIITLFRIWIELLKAYAIILIYVILAPIFIAINLLPKRPLGFERWIRVFFANLALFPATVAMLLLAVVFVDAFSKKPQSFFLPPLIGDPNLNFFGGIIGFAILLLTPQVLSLLREKLGVPPVKQVTAAGQTFAAGRRALGAVPRKTFAGLTRRNAATGAAEAAGSRMMDTARRKVAVGVAGVFRGRGSKEVSSEKENKVQRWARENRERTMNREAGMGFLTDAQLAQQGRGRTKQAEEEVGKSTNPPLTAAPGAAAPPTTREVEGSGGGKEKMAVEIRIRPEGGPESTLTVSGDTSISQVVEERIRLGTISQAGIDEFNTGKGTPEWDAKWGKQVNNAPDKDMLENFLWRHENQTDNPTPGDQGNTPPPTD